MTPLRRESSQNVLGDHLGTHDELSSTEYVKVPTIDGSFTHIEARKVSASEWLRKLVQKGLQQIGSKEAAEAALHAVTISGTEAWKAAACRLVVLYRAFTADPVRPHMSEEIFFWRYITEAQLMASWNALSNCCCRACSTSLACRGWCMSDSCIHTKISSRCR